MGAPVGSYYPEVARRLGAPVIPPHAGVCNAVGAVAAASCSPYRPSLPRPTKASSGASARRQCRFSELERAARMHSLRPQRSRRATRSAGAADIELRQRRADKVHRDPSGLQIFIESRIDVTAFGRPRVALREVSSRQHQRVGRVPGQPTTHRRWRRPGSCCGPLGTLTFT
jgi:hypothetical protein